MKWSRFIPLTVLVVVNLGLCVSMQRQLAHTRAERAVLSKDIDELNRLSAEVEQKSKELKKLAASVHCKPDSHSTIKNDHADESPVSAAQPSQCAMIHKPKSGCPAGYTAEKFPRFTEKDGSRQFACISEDPAKQPCIDVLQPGESVEMHFIIPLDPQRPEPAREEGLRT